MYPFDFTDIHNVVDNIQVQIQIQESLEDQIQKFMFPHEYSELYDPTKPYEPLSTTAYANKYCSVNGRRKAKYRDSDVSHIFSRANGGVDCSENYFMGSSSFNRSIGCRGDHLNVALVGLKRAKKAEKISREYGSYDGESAETLYWKGVEEWGKYGILMKPTGGYDRRSKAFRRGEARLNKDGVTLDGRCKVARELKKKYKHAPL